MVVQGNNTLMSSCIGPPLKMNFYRYPAYLTEISLSGVGVGTHSDPRFWSKPQNVTLLKHGSLPKLELTTIYTVRPCFLTWDNPEIRSIFDGLFEVGSNVLLLNLQS